MDSGLLARIGTYPQASKNCRYGVDMEGFWLCDKFRIMHLVRDTLLGGAPGTNLQPHTPFLGRAK